MKEKIAKMLHIEVNEGKQLGENINKIINDYYNLAHGVCQEELDDLSRWLKQQI